MKQNRYAKRLVSQQPGMAGLPVRTGLRGGVCVDVNDQVKAALETLTSALGGTTTASTAPTTASNTATISS